MHVLIDHLAATLVGGIVLFMLVFLITRMGETDTDQQIFEASQRFGQSLAQQLEGDLQNIGYGVPRGLPSIGAWTDSTIAFRRRDSEDPTSPLVTVQYTRRTTGTAEINGVLQPTYTVTRRQDGVPDGGSGAVLSAFEIDLLDAAGADTADPDLARAIRAQFVVSFGDDDDHADNASRFNRIFHPANLAD